MYYELYVDSLFLINFVMNLYLLLLINQNQLCTATRRGMIGGAAAGSVAYLLPFFWEGCLWIKLPIAIGIGITVMVLPVFKPGNPRAFFKIVGMLFQYSFLMGGLLLLVLESVPFLRERAIGICEVLGVGAIGYLLFTWMQDRRKKEESNLCTATLIRMGKKISVSALIDTGNSLKEPISEKPVSVIDSEIFRSLWSDGEHPYRVIPYCSVGKKHGLLKGYFVDEMIMEVNGFRKSVHNACIAVSEEDMGNVKLILNPEIFEEI